MCVYSGVTFYIFRPSSTPHETSAEAPVAPQSARREARIMERGTRRISPSCTGGPPLNSRRKSKQTHTEEERWLVLPFLVARILGARSEELPFSSAQKRGRVRAREEMEVPPPPVTFKIHCLTHAPLYYPHNVPTYAGAPHYSTTWGQRGRTLDLSQCSG